MWRTSFYFGHFKGNVENHDNLTRAIHCISVSWLILGVCHNHIILMHFIIFKICIRKQISE